MPRKNSREAILDAAEEVVMRVGASHMTLDAVAKRAGVSKGGLIYNFLTKEELLKAMITRLVERKEAAHEKECTRLGGAPGREVRAFVVSSLRNGHKDKRLSAALLAAAAHDPRLMKPARDHRRRLFRRLASAGIGPEKAAVIMAAAEGLWLADLLGLSTYDAALRTRVVEELLRLSGG